MAFADIDKFKVRIKGLREDEDIEADSTEETIANSCLVDAYNCINTALMARGLSAADVDTWSEGEPYELDIATFFFGQRMGWEKRMDEEDEDSWLIRFDRREELKTVPILLTSGTVITQQQPSSAFDNFNLDEINQEA